MEEDWGACASDARPTFSLFQKISPEEEAKKPSFVDVIVYNRWTKAERRLYQKLKTKYILKQIEEEKLKSMDDIINSLDQLAIIKTDNHDPSVDNVISRLEGLRLNFDQKR